MISERAFSRSFESFWHELFPLLTPQFVRLFNEAYEEPLYDAAGNAMFSLPIAPEVDRVDIVAEFAFRLAKLAFSNEVALDTICENDDLIHVAEMEAMQLIQQYEGNKPECATPLSGIEKTEGIRLCHRYSALYERFETNVPIQYCPKFSGAGFLSACEGDIGIANSLVEVKTTTRRASGRDIRQLLIYCALDTNHELRRWSRIAIFNPRRGTFHSADISSLVFRISGGKPDIDVFGELVAFVESTELVVDRRF